MSAPARPPLVERIARGDVYRSIVRHGRLATPRDRALAILSNVFLHVHPVKVSRHALRIRSTFGLGFLSSVLFVVLATTGAILMFYYVPDPARAYADMKDLRYAVPFGRFLRNMHRWAAHAMVLVAILHMARVFYSGAYRPPRQFNWVVGVGLLVLTLLMSFTGYLLPMDQLAYWAITVGTSMAEATPLVGARGPFHELLGVTSENDVRFALLGGTTVGSSALIRFYVLHCVVAPLVMVALIAVHVWRVRKDGGIARPDERALGGSHA